MLNEVVIDRGASSYLCNLDLYIEGHLVTSVLGDGEYDMELWLRLTVTFALRLFRQSVLFHHTIGQ